MTYLEFWENFESKTYAIYQNNEFENVALFHLSLNWPPSPIKSDDVIGLNDCSYRDYVQNDPENMCRTAYLLVTNLLVNLMWPDLDIHLLE